MIKLYAIGGLGADERVFQYLNVDMHVLEWIDPEGGETLESYANRLTDQINTSESFILIGVSFGGMLAVELNKLIQPKKTIIVSSSATYKELPKIVKLIKKLHYLKVIPTKFLKPPSFVMNWLFGVKNLSNKKLLAQIIRDTNPNFIRWAMHQIVKWKNEVIPKNLVRIHGSKDRLLKMQTGNTYKVVKGGGHFMIAEQADIISKLIKDEI